jgi:hypothetical protein
LTLTRPAPPSASPSSMPPPDAARYVTGASLLVDGGLFVNFQ